MTQCYYKIHREDHRNFQEIDTVATSQFSRGNTKGISNQYLNATGEWALIKKYSQMYVKTHSSWGLLAIRE